MKTITGIIAVLLSAVLCVVGLSSCECSHEWNEATCLEPRTCSKCGAKEGSALGHDWKAATTEAPKTCSRCGLTEGEALIAVPDVLNIDEQTAKNVCSSKGLIPKVEYAYDDYVDEGNVIKTSPNIGDGLKSDDTVTLTVSKGPSYIMSNHSTISWQSVGYSQDEWDFYSPYIKNGILYIECEVTFAETIKWKNWKNNEGFGNASITDTFDKVVPVVIQAKSETCPANEQKTIVLQIPLSDLNVSKPTTMSLQLIALNQYDSQVNVNIKFSMTW